MAQENVCIWWSNRPLANIVLLAEENGNARLGAIIISSQEIMSTIRKPEVFYNYHK